jgi:hypothetical protein
MKRIIQTLFLIFVAQAAFSQTNCHAAFTFYTDSSNHYLTLHNQSYNNDSTPINVMDYLWIVQYGGAVYTYTDENPIIPLHEFNGPVLVCLTINTIDSCSSSFCDTVNPYYPSGSLCNAFFTANYTVPFTYNFLNESCTGDTNATINFIDWTITTNGGGYFFNSHLQDISVVFPYSGCFYMVLNIGTSSGCHDIYAYNLCVPDTGCIVANEYIVNVSTFGGNNGAIYLNVSGGIQPYTFNWSNGSTDSYISGLSAGFYTVNITQMDSTCPTYTNTYQITEPPDSIPLDTLFALPVDTCLNFVPDSIYAYLVNFDSTQITVAWVFIGQGMTQTLTVVYAYPSFGSYAIALTIDCGAKSLTTYFSYINISSSFGLNEIKPEDIKIYPNPVSNSFSIEMPAGIANAIIQVYNSMGQLMTTIATGNNAKATIDASQWPAGIYVVRISDGQGQYITKNIVKQ